MQDLYSIEIDDSGLEGQDVALQEAFQDILRMAFQLTGREVASRFQSGERGYPESGPLYRRSGSLQEAITDDGAVTVTLASGEAEAVFHVRLPYANIQERGGRIRVTQAMRDFFFAMYRETEDEKWFAMYLSQQEYFTITPRLGMIDALQNLSTPTMRELNQRLQRALK